MSDPTLDDVLKEAYASASPDKIDIDTLSFWFDGMEPTEAGDAELYLFRGENATQITESGVPLLTARIENTSPRNAGQLVTFLGIPFDITLPPMNSEAVAAAELTVDSVGREAHDLLEAAATGGKSIEVTYRKYIKGNELTGPQSLPPRRFTLIGATGANASISARLVFLAIGNRPFPFDIYTPSRFKTLQYG